MRLPLFRARLVAYRRCATSRACLLVASLGNVKHLASIRNTASNSGNVKHLGERSEHKKCGALSMFVSYGAGLVPSHRAQT